MPGFIRGHELWIILIIVLLIFGPKHIPSLAKALGKSIKEFRSGAKTGLDDEDESSPDEPASEKPSNTQD